LRPRISSPVQSATLPPGIAHLDPDDAVLPAQEKLPFRPKLIFQRSPVQAGFASLEPAVAGDVAIAGAGATVPGRRYPVGDALAWMAIDDSLIRLFDIVGALIALLIAFPVMVFVALAVKLTSPGPVLFAHRRVGRHGRRFACLKFRTMAIDADAQLKALLDSDPEARAEWQTSQKLRRDPRVTSIGRFLRRTSLDELPQLFTVLWGDMSLVGPRPIVEAEIPRYGRHYAIYCRVRPGVTGLWQVQRDADTSYRRRVAFDVAFARGRSLRLYLLILARTVPAVLSGRGAC